MTEQKNGKLANKFTALGMSLLVAIVVPIVPLLQGYDEQLTATEAERGGVAVHREMRVVLQEAQRHRGASTALLSGKTEFRERADKARTVVDQATGRVDAALTQHASQVGKNADWERFKTEWKALLGEYTTYAPQENAHKHDVLIGILLDAMARIGDQSGLVLDPELESYYLMDTAIVQLPLATERMGQARALGAVILTDQALSQERRDIVIGAFSEMRLRERTIIGNSQRFIAASQEARERLKTSFDAARDGMTHFIDSTSNNILTANQLIYEPTKYFDEATRAIDHAFRYYDEGMAHLDHLLEVRMDRIKQSRLLVLLIILAIVGVASMLALMVLGKINRSVVAAVDALNQIAGGRFDVPLQAESQDELGHLIDRLDDMQKQLHARIEADQKKTSEALRIKVALDVSSTNVMVADADGKIIYCNQAALQLMRAAESDIRKQLPNFRADALLGSNIDSYHRQPSHQRNLLSSLKGSHRAEMEAGGRHFTLVATPIVDAEGRHQGTVAEWSDRTAEILVQREVAEIIQAAANGDFSRRLDANRMSGFFRQIGEGINQLLEANTAALTDLGAMLTRLSQGDLSRKINTDYHGMLGTLKDDANATVDNLREIVAAIKRATEAINMAAKEISMGNQDLSGRTEEQASSLEETASSMEELTGTVKQNAESARSASELAGQAQDVAVRGGQVVGQVVDTMNAIHQSSNRIADIIGVIDGIAFQTNILALNAAVEAARAGEQGRGFAVVATEVRNLAQRSAAAAKEIKALISESVGKVETGNRLVDQAGRTMNEVVTAIKRVTAIVTDISAASREQTSGIEQVNLAVSQMDEMTQQNAALVEQAAAAAESLAEQAMGLTGAVAAFDLGGQRAETTAALRQKAAPRQLLPKRESVRLEAPVKAREKQPVQAAAEDEWEEF